ncbi:MAG: hypothetical protein RIB32_01010 [Phycisphaerales bacterium]
MRGFECVVLGVAVGAAATLTGCQPLKVAPDSAMQDPLPVESYPAIAVHPALAQVIVTDFARIQWTPGQAGEVASLEVPVRSIAQNPVWVQHRALWFDASEMQVGATEWQRTFLEPQFEQRFSANSGSDEVRYWRLEIRPAR